MELPNALVTRVLLAAGATVWMEHPGYADTTALLQASDVQVVAVPVDDDGLVMEIGEPYAPTEESIK